MHSDTAGSLDEGSMTALVMLDLSAAFDVIDHLILWNQEKGLNLGNVVPR